MAATVFCIRVVLTKEILSIVIKCIKQHFGGFYVLLEMKFTIYGTQIHAKINFCLVTLNFYLFHFDLSFTYFKYHQTYPTIL